MQDIILEYLELLSSELSSHERHIEKMKSFSKQRKSIKRRFEKLSRFLDKQDVEVFEKGSDTLLGLLTPGSMFQMGGELYVVVDMPLGTARTVPCVKLNRGSLQEIPADELVVTFRSVSKPDLLT